MLYCDDYSAGDASAVVAAVVDMNLGLRLDFEPPLQPSTSVGWQLIVVFVDEFAPGAIDSAGTIGNSPGSVVDSASDSSS